MSAALEGGREREEKQRARVFSFITFIFNLSAHAMRACECTAEVGEHVCRSTQVEIRG